LAKVLIVDDDEPLRRLTRLILDAEHECIEAQTAAAALTLIQTEAPELVISDLLLPGQDGLSLIEEARRGGYNGAVLLLTAADPAMHLLHEAEEALGAASVLLKPFEPDDLIRRVDDLLAGQTTGSG